MKKFFSVKSFWLVAVSLLLMLLGPVFAREVRTIDMVNAAGETTIACASTDTVYTRSFQVGEGEYFGISYWTYASTGTSEITVVLEESFEVPTTEGAADTGEWSTPLVSGSALSNVVTNYQTESTWQHTAFSPVPMKYYRFKVTGSGSNNATNVVKIKVHTYQNN